jgi:hypothetical protein
MRLSIAILLAAAIAAPRLRTLHAIDVAQQQQSHLSLLPRPPLEDNAHEHERRGVSARTYGELERFAKYASAAYQYLCPRPLGNTLVRSVSRARSRSLL